MHAPRASVFVTLGITILALYVFDSWPRLLGRVIPYDERRRKVVAFAGVLGVWVLFWCLLAGLGILADVTSRPPPFMLLPVSLVIGVILIVRSRIGALLVTNPYSALIGSQIFRFPLELVMHQAASEQVMPAQMTFASVAGHMGYNYDIVTGITALCVVLVWRQSEPPRGVVIAWNVLGLLLLLNVVGIAVASTPMFARFGTEPFELNTWVFYFPFVLLPAVLVGSALLAHVLIFRKLIERTDNTFLSV